MLLKEVDLSRRFGSNGNYEHSFIELVVGEVEGGERSAKVAFKYQLSRSTLTGWLKLYGSPEYHKGKKKAFSTQVRRSICRAINDGRMTIAQAQSAYQIRASHTIKRWMRLEEQENTDLADSNSITMKKDKPASPPADHSDISKLAALKQQLADAHLKIAALNTLIDVAEEQLNIDIRKKPGAKQL
jgi:transposase-like protein